MKPYIVVALGSIFMAALMLEVVRIIHRIRQTWHQDGSRVHFPKGYARPAGIAFIVALLIVSLGSGYTGAFFAVSHADAKARKYDTFTIGCDKLGHLQDCTESEMVKVFTKQKSPHGGWEYKLGYNSVSLGYLEPLVIFCPDYEPPFEPGDFAIYMRYEDRPDQGCKSLRPEYTGTQLRRINNRTDSEIAAQKGGAN